jgi:formate hydrogenlyase subunit 3/multisubunit Na+/H+ antiporter MnhD subunit
MRLVGLTLFAIIVGKVFIVDLARLDQVYRVVAFILLGILVLCGSFVYLKYRNTFATEEVSEGDSPKAESLSAGHLAGTPDAASEPNAEEDSPDESGNEEDKS